MDGRDDEARLIQRGRRRTRGLMLGVALVFGVLGALGVLLARDLFGAGWSSWWEGDAPAAAQINGVVLVVLGLVVEVGAVGWAVRRGRYRSSRESPMWAMPMRRRSRLIKQVRRGTAGPDADLPTLTLVARQMVESGWWVVLAAGLVTVNLGQMLIRVTSPAFVALFGLVAVMFALAGWQVHLNARRAAEFLRHHAAEPPAATPTNV
ncbi:hypothetical protein AB0H28_03025 [Micromonospora sp. NPDC050980]|uniref:hypothetical protein n=1 Tax=Micromonospora sp. NPDC050980 TaxID=3155161 RepID=UPI0033D76F2A